MNFWRDPDTTAHDVLHNWKVKNLIEHIRLHIQFDGSSFILDLIDMYILLNKTIQKFKLYVPV